MIAGTGIFALCQWLVMVVIARIGGAHMLGQFALAVAITTPVMIFANMGLRQTLATDQAHNSPFTTYLGTKMLSSGTGFIVICIIAGIFALHSPFQAGLIACMGLARLFENLSDIHYGLFQREEHSHKVAASLALRGIGAFVAVAGVLAFTTNLLYAAAAYAGVWLMVWLGHDVLRTRPRSLKKIPRSQELSNLLMFALPVGVSAFLISLNANIIRYALEGFVSTDALGVFAAFMHFILIGTLTLTAAAGAVTPRLARYWHNGDKRAWHDLFARMAASAVALGAAGLALAFMWGEKIIHFTYGPAFTPYSNLLVHMAAAAILLYTGNILNMSLTATRAFKSMAPLYAITTLITFGASFWLIPAYGLNGAAAALVILGAANCLLPGCLLMRLHRQRN